MPLAGGTMLGVGRTIKNGKTIGHEFMQIRLSAQGTVVYVALPSGQKEATFALKHSSTTDVIFENPEHDFPQRVIYRSLPGDRLAARIEGILKGVPRAKDFPMRRVSCDAQLNPAKEKLNE